TTPPKRRFLVKDEDRQIIDEVLKGLDPIREIAVTLETRATGDQLLMLDYMRSYVEKLSVELLCHIRDAKLTLPLPEPIKCRELPYWAKKLLEINFLPHVASTIRLLQVLPKDLPTAGVDVSSFHVEVSWDDLDDYWWVVEAPKGRWPSVNIRTHS